MKLANKKDLMNLKIGEEVIKKENSIYFEKYIYQGMLIHKNGKTTMNGISEYLIICCGTKCETIFMGGEDDELFGGKYYIGEYDNKFIGNEIIKDSEDTIRMAKKIFLKK